MNALEPIQNWALMHPALVYFSIVAILLALMMASLFYQILVPPLIDYSMCLPELIAAYDADRLRSKSADYLEEAQQLADSTIVELKGSFMPEDIELRRKLQEISERITQLVTLHFGIDGMTRLHHHA